METAPCGAVSIQRINKLLLFSCSFGGFSSILDSLGTRLHGILAGFCGSLGNILGATHGFLADRHSRASDCLGRILHIRNGFLDIRLDGISRAATQGLDVFQLAPLYW